ncbi:LOW QUALITY PROTEIN: Integrase, catalytic core protein [Phytophthora megakarya]|uniref:Integrase, catalytic core protein n=1 Tax=Phytophthora megakarya TaxID=4795 RepID=A0A225USI6_9STRA|nr:LOW QUALITY PROTEIN: Integrase, catalytic core protein [Phytophthora megakarya]
MDLQAKPTTPLAALIASDALDILTFVSSMTYLGAKPLIDPTNLVFKRATSLLSKVHSDICDPLPVTKVTGRRYFLIFIDDFSRSMFTYAIKNRSELHDCFEGFRKKALNIFRQDISVIEYTFSVEDYDSQGNIEIQRPQANNANV